VNIILIASIEICFNVYPATWWSSLLLQVCHLIILTGLLVSPVPYEEGVKLIRGAPHAKNQ
jgi:alpha-1,3-mannosyltransferase